MIENKKDLQNFIKVEKSKYSIKNDFLSIIYSKFGSETNSIWQFQKRMRLTEYYKNTNKKIRFLFSFIKYRKLSIKYCFNIPLNTCDIGLKIMHIGSILINPNCKIGKNLSIHINSALVAGGVGKDNAPSVGNDVVIGVSSILCGKIFVSNGIAVGANSFVNRSFYEENITIAGSPAKKISDGGKEKWNK